MLQFIILWRNSYEGFISKPISRPVRYALLGTMMVLILLVRLATISFPALEWTAWKEIDYLYISQNFWQQGFDFFHPEMGWPAEPPRVTEMELPLVPFVAALFYEFFGFSAYTARATTMIASLVMMFYVYKLVTREVGESAGVIAAFTAGVLPLYHPFSRFLFTEPVMIALSVASLYYVAEWVEFERRRDFLMAFIMFSLTIALKLESLYLFLPISWIAFRKYGWGIKQYKRLAFLLILALILPALWYIYAYYLEITGAHLFGIFIGHDKSQTLSMLSNIQWYRTMAGRVINGILGGFFGTALFVTGLASAVWLRKAGLFVSYLAAVGVYFALVAEGNIDAPYRQLPLIPSASLFIALGVQAVIAIFIAFTRTLKRDRAVVVSNQSHSVVPLLACFVLVVIIPWQNFGSIIGYNGPAHTDRWELAQKITKYSGEESKLIVVGEYSKHVGGYDLSPVLYYYSNLQGWTLTPEDWNLEKIKELSLRGATLFVAAPPYNDPNAVNYQPEQLPVSFIVELKKHYPVLYENPNQIILDLSNPFK